MTGNGNNRRVGNQFVRNSRTTFGYEMRAVGANARAARFAGIALNTVVVKTALLSGALAGLAGVGEVAGRAGYLTLDMSPGYGYSGIVIAMLAGLNPLGVVLAALFACGGEIRCEIKCSATGATVERTFPSCSALRDSSSFCTCRASSSVMGVTIPTSSSPTA